MLAIDFDGVIHSYQKGRSAGSIYGYQLPGAKETLNELKETYFIIIHTARIYDNPEQKRMLETWLTTYDIYYDIIEAKIIAAAYIDDRAIWIDPVNNIQWNTIYDRLVEIKNKTLNL